MNDPTSGLQTRADLSTLVALSATLAFTPRYQSIVIYPPTWSSSSHTLSLKYSWHPDNYSSDTALALSLSLTPPSERFYRHNNN